MEGEEEIFSWFFKNDIIATTIEAIKGIVGTCSPESINESPEFSRSKKNVE